MRKINPAVPADLEAICLKCLEKKPADRYQTTTELAEDLEKFLSKEPVNANKGFSRKIRRWMIREPVLFGSLAAIGLLMIIVFTNYMAFSKPGNETSWRLFLGNEAVLITWACVLFVLQKIQNVVRSERVVPLVWAAISPIFLTWVMTINLAPRLTLHSTYLLCLVMTCFFRRADIVIAASVTSLIGLLSIILFVEADDQTNHPSYKVVAVTSVVACGLMCAFLASVLNRLSRTDRTP